MQSHCERPELRRLRPQVHVVLTFRHGLYIDLVFTSLIPSALLRTAVSVAAPAGCDLAELRFRGPAWPVFSSRWHSSREPPWDSRDVWKILRLNLASDDQAPAHGDYDHDRFSAFLTLY